VDPSHYADGAPDGALAESTNGTARSSRRPKPRAAVNTIRAVDTPSPERVERRSAAESAMRAIVVPQTVLPRYVQVSEREFHFHNGKHAFTNHGTHLSTRSEDAQLLADFVTTLQATGAKTVAVTGTQKFRQRAWRAAVSAGLSLEGYTPTAFETAKFLNGSASTARAESSPADKPAPREARRSAPSGELIVGDLLEHGRAPEDFDPHGAPSYYVRLATKSGERTLFGADLERAFAVSRTKPQVGNTIGVRSLARDQLLVKPEPAHTPTAQRGDDAFYIVEKRQFFAMRSAAATVLRDPDFPSDLARAKFPELDGAYAMLKVVARAPVSDERTRADRFVFLNAMREQLAMHLERGEPVPTLKGLERSLRSSVNPARPPHIQEPMVR